MTDEDPLAGLCAYLLWLGSGAHEGWLDRARETRQCGFADLSHFSHRFASIYRMPPTGCRADGSRTPSVLEHGGLRRLHHLVWE